MSRWKPLPEVTCIRWGAFGCRSQKAPLHFVYTIISSDSTSPNIGQAGRSEKEVCFLHLQAPLLAPLPAPAPCSDTSPHGLKAAARVPKSVPKALEGTIPHVCVHCWGVDRNVLLVPELLPKVILGREGKGKWGKRGREGKARERKGRREEGRERKRKEGRRGREYGPGESSHSYIW